MDSPLASLLGLLFTAVALYGFYWVIRLAVRDGMLDADRRRRRDPASSQPAQPASPAQPAEPASPAQPAQPASPAQPAVAD